MLNELAALSKSLSARGIQTKEWHPWIKALKKGEALVVELDPEGMLARVSLLPREQVAALRNIAPDNQKSFPAFNLSCPLFRLQDEALWSKPEALWSAAIAAVVDGELAYKKTELSRVKRLLLDFPRTEIRPRLRGCGAKITSTFEVIDRLEKSKYAPEQFIRTLAREILTAEREARIPRKVATEVLFGKPKDAKNKTKKLVPWTVIFDVSDLEAFEYRVADPAVAPAWSDLLLSFDRQSANTAAAAPFICALSGESDVPVGNKMPEPDLGPLGPSYLMAMNRNVPCQTRYGRTSTGVFPIGKQTSQRLNDAVLFLVDRSRKGKTWAAVPNAFKRNQSDLLLSYLEDEPDSVVPVVGFFADVEERDSDAAAAVAVATYESRTSEIHSALRLRDRVHKDSYVRLIALSKLDKGRRQVLFSGRYSTEAVYLGRENWIAGCRNIPLIVVLFPVTKGKPAEWRSGYQPSPSEVMISFRTQWLRSGRQSQAVPGVELARIYGLLLEPDARVAAASLLDRYLRLTLPLMVGLRSVPDKSASDAARREALIVAAVYGLLLYRQGVNKESYMESRDYLIGRFLQFADQLHRMYCENVRKGKLPPQLIGNAALPMAIQSPQRALTVLTTRMAVYLAWAEQFNGEDVRRVRDELGAISLLLKGQDLAERVSANGKAQLLLGYLASDKKTGEKGAATL